MRTSFLAVAALVPLFPVPAPLLAQVLEREDNTWGWHDHQPAEAWVLKHEEAAGTTASQSQTTADDTALG